MARHGNSKGMMRVVPAVLATAGLVLAAPVTGFAFASSDTETVVAKDFGYLPFTPAKVDARLAQQVAAIIGTDGLRFTPAASGAARKDRTVTVAVRVDDATVRALSIRKAIESSSGLGQGRASVLALAPTRYDLGVSRGYQNFAQPVKAAPSVAAGLRDMKMPDIGEYRTETGSSKPSRFQPRIALEEDQATGRAPRTLQGLGDQRVDVGGSYRLGKNLNVTAGVRLSQDRDRLDPMTDGEDDNKAVYVGTQIRF